MDPEPKFQASAPAIQNCLGSGSIDMLRTRLIHISPSCWRIYRSFEIIHEMGTVHLIGLQTQCSILTFLYIASKNIQSDMNHNVSKNT